MLFSRVGEGRCSRAIFFPNHLSPRKNGYIAILLSPPGKMAIFPPSLSGGKNGYVVEFPPGKMSSPFTSRGEMAKCGFSPLNVISNLL